MNAVTTSVDELDDVLSGDLAVMLAQVTPLHGVVLTPVNNFGWDPETRTATFTSSLAAYKKLRRLEQNPRTALVFHARDHGTATGDQYVVLQGDASFSWQPDRAELKELLGGPDVILGTANMGGPVWDSWMAPFFWDRVTVRVTAERVVAFPDSSCRGPMSVFGRDLPAEPPAPQLPPAKGVTPRIDVERAERQIGKLPHRLLGWVGDDGYPMVVPAESTGAGADGIELSTATDLVVGGRRAGLTGHWFSPGTLGQRQLVMTGWLDTDEQSGRLVYAPHTRQSYSLPPNKLLFRGVLGVATRIGLARARRAGVTSNRTTTNRKLAFVRPFQRHIANPVGRRVAPHIPGGALLETIGRVSGLPRTTPIGGRLTGSTFWFVSEFGRQSQYVRNIEADPRVRLQVAGKWHTGTAVLVDDEPRATLKRLPRANSAVVRMIGNDLLGIRIDLDATT